MIRRKITIVITLLVMVFPLMAQEEVATTFNYDLAVKAAFELARDGNYEDARVLCRRVLREKPEYIDARFLMGNTFAWEGDYEEARLIYNEVFDYDFAHKPTMISLADVEIWSGHPAEAMDICESALTYHPDDIDILMKYAKASSQAGDLLNAKKAILLVLTKDQANEEARNLYTQIREGIPFQEDSQTGRSFSNTYSVLHIDTLMYRARNHAFNEEYGAARNLTSTILQRHPDYYPAILLNAYTYAWGNDFENARRELRKYDFPGSQNKEGIIAWVDLEKWDKNFNQSLTYCKLGQRLFPNDLDFLLKASEVYALKGDIIQAKRVLYDELRKGNRSPSLLLAYNQLLNQSSEITKARDARLATDDVFRALNPDSLVTVAQDYANDGMYPEAMDIIEDVLSIQPDYYSARFVKGSIMSWQEDYDGALNVYNDLFKTAFDSYELISAMADVYTWSERFDEALDMIAYGLSIYPNNADLLFKRATVYQRSGNLDLANEELNRLLVEFPDNEMARTTSLAMRGLIPLTAVSGEWTYNRFKKPFNRTWNMFTARYYHTNDIGTFMASTNMGFLTDTMINPVGVQFELDAYPVFKEKDRYFHINYGFSPSTNFARHRFGAHVYDQIGQSGWELGGGFNYMYFVGAGFTNHVFIGNVGLSKFFRSFMGGFNLTFAPNNGKVAQGYALTLRKFLDNQADNWLQFTVGTGIYPNNPIYYINDNTYSPNQMLNSINLLGALRYRFAPRWIGRIYAGVSFEEYKLNTIRNNSTLNLALIYLLKDY